MAVSYTPWGQLPPAVRAVVAQHLEGPYTAATPGAGANSGTSAVLTTRDGRRVFVKGQHGDAPRDILEPADDLDGGSDWWGTDWGPVDQLGEEVRINPYLPATSPRVLWCADADGWHLAAFTWIDGRHADYRPGSPDLPAVAGVLAELGACPTPPIPLPTARDRWGYYCDPAHRHLLDDGRTLLHTDPAAVNVLIAPGGQAHLVDWAWPAIGPSWVDAALWGMRLVVGGHAPESAATLAAGISGWADAKPEAIRAFTQAESRRWQHEAERGTYGADGVVDGAIAWADWWT